MNLGGSEASRRADGSRRTRLSGTADHAREEEIAAQLVQQAMNERQHFQDQTVALLQSGRILIGKVVSYAPAEGSNPPTWNIKLLNGSTITSNSFAEMADAARRMAELNEIAPPRTLGLPAPHVASAVTALNRLSLPKQSPKPSSSGVVAKPVAAAKKSKHDVAEYAVDLPTGLDDIGRRVCVMYGGRFRIGVVVDFTPLSDLTSPIKPEEHNPEQQDHWRVRYFTGGEEDLELPDLIDGLERYRQLREPEQQGLLAKEEQPYLDPDYGTLPASKDEDLRFECDHCHKKFKSRQGLAYHERGMVCVRREERKQMVAKKLGVRAVKERGDGEPRRQRKRKERDTTVNTEPENPEEAALLEQEDEADWESYSEASSDYGGGAKGKRGRRFLPAPTDFSQRHQAMFPSKDVPERQATAEMLRRLARPGPFAADQDARAPVDPRAYPHVPLSTWAQQHGLTVPNHALLLRFAHQAASTNEGTGTERAEKQPGLLLPAFSGSFAGVPGVDLYLNAGGPVWALAFHPGKAAPGTRQHEDTHTYLAVGVSRLGWEGTVVAADRSYPIGERCSGPNVLQLWRIRQARSAPSISAARPQPTRTVQLDYAIGHARGPIWDLSWYVGAPPIGAASLGHLACVCGGGSCVIYQLPQFAPPPPAASSIDAEDPRVIDEASVIRCELLLGDGVCILTASWSPHEKGVLLTGFTDGSLGVWRLASLLDDAAAAASAASSARKGNGHPVLTRPDLRFVDLSVEQGASLAGMCAVRAVSWSPFHPHLFASGGYDGSLKVWQLNDTSKPLYTHHKQVGWLYDVTWCPQGNCIYYCGSDEPKCICDPLWLDARRTRTTLYAHSETTHGPVWKARAVRRGDAVFTVSVSGGGTAILGDVSALTATKARNFPIVRMFSIANVRDPGDAPIRTVEIDVDSSRHFIRQPKEEVKGTLVVPDTITAIYALAIGASPDEADSSCSGLAAYGTALGLVRCHALPI